MPHPCTSSLHQVSVLKDIAAQFGLEPFVPVTVQRVEPDDVTVDFLELSFKDQFLSRADIWRFKVAMLGKCVHVGKNVACLGVRSQVEGLLANNRALYCGVVGADTKMIVRSRSSRLFWLVQMSAEMWEFAPDGELYYEKLINRLLRVMIAKWNESSVSHSVTIIAFSRSFYDRSQFPADYDPLVPPFSEPTQQYVGLRTGAAAARAMTPASGCGPTIHVDALSGRYYEDFYKVLVMNYTGPDWDHLLGILKREFANYHERHRWRSPDEVIPAEYVVHKPRRKPDDALEELQTEAFDSDVSTEPCTKADASIAGYVHWKTLPFGVPARAMDGNILEAINVTLNILDKHYMDRDLSRTGQSIVMLTAGCSIFHVDERLAQITKQRMMDNGVGMDMISLTTPPMHVVPLFISQRPTDDATTVVDGCDEDAASPQRRDTFSAMSDAPSSPGTIDEYALQGLEKEIREFEQSGWESGEHSSTDSVSNTADAHGLPQEPSSVHDDRIFSIPHWVNITFLDFDCQCASKSLKRGGAGSAVGSRQFPLSESLNSSTSEGSGSGSAQYAKNRLLSHRAQACECQYAMNQRFLPLPPFRMFDLTAPTAKMSFPVALKNLIQGYPRTVPKLEPGFALSIVGPEHDSISASQQQSRRRLGGSDMSDALSRSSAVLPVTCLQICKSPEYDASLPLKLTTAASSFSASSFINREAFEAYDDEVFSTASIAGLRSLKQVPYHPSSSPPRSFRKRSDRTSATFSGDTSLAEAMAATRTGKGHSFSRHERKETTRGFGTATSSSIVGSLLSPRNDASAYVQQRRSNAFAALPPPVPFKRVSTSEDLATMNALKSSDSMTSVGKTALSTSRGDVVHPQQVGLIQRSASAWQPVPRHARNAATMTAATEQAEEDDSYPISGTDSNESAGQLRGGLLLAKSADSSHRFLAARSFKEGSEAAAKVGAMRMRACVSAYDIGGGLPDGSLKDSGFLHLSRSMTMKPTPSYYNDLLLRSPPPSVSALAATASLSPHGPGHYNALQTLSTARSIRRGHSDVLSPSLFAPAAHSFGHPQPAVFERVSSLAPTNPFKYASDTFDAATERLTSDRRRWSHLFPVLTGNQQTHASIGANAEKDHQLGDKAIHLGPNWKSLTSPAILPLTTDYYPSAKELRTSYTESFYTLTLPSMLSETVPKYSDHNELLIEMVCQRLAGDFQLVATDSYTDSEPAHHHVTGVLANRGPSGESRLPNNAVTYYLSMGHRIHHMVFDPELQTIVVKRYFQRGIQSDTTASKTYRYSLWVDFTAAFHPLQQMFHEYPQPEENWNSLDHLLCGYHDDMSDLTKCRRIRFALVPPKGLTASALSAEQAAVYAAKFSKLIDYLQTRIAPADDGVRETISIRYKQLTETETDAGDDGGARMNVHPAPQQPGTLSYKICCKSSSSFPGRGKSDDTRAEWVMIHLEDTLDAARNYHLDVRWLACSGIVADEFVSALKRKCKQSGLELRRVPEYSRISFLQIHPLIAPIFLPTPLQSGWHPDNEQSLTAVLVDRLDFVLDDERLADSNGIGYGLGIEREERKQTPGNRFQASFRQRRHSEASTTRLLVEKWRTRGYKQFMHRSLPVFLRLVSSGLVWIPSYDYDEKSDSVRVEALFREICGVVHARATLQDLVDSCCCSEAA